MRKMKNSGIVWIGEIPEGWGIVLLSSIFKQRKEKNINNKENNLLSLSYGKIIRKDISISDGLLPQSYETYNIINNGDIVFRLTDLQNDKRSLRTGLCKEKGIITSAYVTIKPTVELSSEYMQYLYHSYDICKVFYGMGDGVRQGMNYDDLRRLPTLFPEYEEQQQIADFLDKKCAEIDKLIELQESMIEKLKEYKQSVITQAVTKGLNPDVPMKDSGIEWIGKIPEGWEIKKLKHTASQRNEKNIYEDLSYIGLENIVSFTGQYIESESSYDISQSILCKTGDVLFGKLRPYLAKVYLIERESCCSTEFIVLKQAKVPSYIKYIMLSNWFVTTVNNSTYGTKMPRANADYIKNVYITVPPTEEQHQIADYLDKKCAEIDDLIKLKEQKIEKLKEYKKSLIYEYVTGKKEVV